MSFPAYPEYKDSGVVWLGGIPAHWNIKKFRYVFEESPEKITDEVVGDMLSVSGYRGIEVKQYDDEGRRRTDEELFGYRVVRPGQLVVNTMWLNYAGLGVSEHEGHVSPAYRSYWLDPAMDKRFIHHLMRSGTYVQGYTRLLTGIRPNSLQMGRDDLMVFPVLLPTKSEQTQIARFLDHETARIDALIEEQQRLIELLKEKRQAVISHAVTKGLDPTVPMKDSGVEWLGEVPAHWNAIHVGRVCRKVSDGPHFSPNYVDDGVMFLSARNIAVDAWHLEDAKFVSEEDYREFCRRVVPEKGDVLYTKGGTTGIARVVDLDEKFQVWVHVAVLKLDRELVDPYYMAFSLNSAGCYEQSQLHTRGATNQDLGLTRMTKIWFALPPREEQTRICDFLNAELGNIDDLIAEATKVVALLSERRSALISAAVTGKIDVRNW
ncbi:restriction endonuclease subunit S [Pseudomonas aeruginosa]|uniref:restriction endonuclease subunit S n=1 Tax=Pseudomonas aeruginosa TaxID=287 RepID=UPI00191BA234|nr:restriction endonuclease subunit S [Pseudomonas aeruginosa]GLE66881.1 restriction modification system DNA specificity domain-containing protein [Pseudomonas aeruginosa]HBO7306880.1 restriction endonuclease subunit S [Pseudomonas aeruginosa]